ncbi:MAG: TonB-dependent receptor [Cyclobacteriaceae bacterium]|nr:TonB-dependent receptor [Cyclobacteriaceae bacterium]
MRTIAMAIVLLLLYAPDLMAQSRTITGTVKSDGEVLPGVSVMEKGTTNGTVTDSDGKFTISVSANATLVFSFVGMTPQEVIVGNQTSIDVNMITDISQLEEVVVIGYGTVKKSDLTGSVVSVGGDDLKKMPVATVTETLTGRMAGVHVSSSEGSPDAEIRIRVRGGTSLSQDNNPLYIVDGFPIESINDISPSDIESITILKDASSTAIYGSRGANGVVIITTKGGTSDGKVAVSYNAFAGFKRIAKTLDVLAPDDYVKWQYEYAMLRDNLDSYERYFGTYEDIGLYNGLKGNDWQRQVYGRTGTVFSNDLSVRGGDSKFNYSLNYARFQEKAIMIGSDFKRDNITVKLNNKPNNKIDIGFSLRYSATEVNGGGANEQNERSSTDSRLKHSVSYAPLHIPGLVVDSDDTNEQLAGDLTNPIRATWDNNRYQERNNFNIGGSFGWKIIDNLRLKVEGGIDTYNTLDYRFYGLTTYYSKNQGENAPAVVMADGKSTRLRNTNTLGYDFKDIIQNSDHRLNVLLGHEVLVNRFNRLTSTIHGFDEFYDSDAAFRLTAQGSPVSVDNFYAPDDKLLSFFARVNYDFKGRYLLDAVYRADGSSKFLGNNIWGYFPSISAGWKVSEEGFMQDAGGWLNSLKLRASIGAVGNNNIPTGQTFQFFESGTGASLTWVNGVNTFWAASRTMANPDLKWETTVTTNIGLDFGLLQNRITGTLELYKNLTKDLLVRFPTTGTGYIDQFRNMGETENKGVELSLTYAAIDREKYGLNFTFNTAVNRNVILSLGSLDEIIAGTNSNWASTQIGSDYQVRVGNSIGAMYGYVNDGRYEVSDFDGYNAGTDRWILKEGVADASGVSGTVGTARPGMMKLKDISGPDGVPDGIVDAYDQKVIGNFQPKHTGGFVINGYAYGFDLTAAFNYSYGNDVYNANKIEYTTANQNNQYRNLVDIMADGNRWTNINAAGELVTDMSELTALNANTTMWSPYMNRYVFSDWAVEDGSFLRLNTLTLGYTFPSDLTSKARIKNFRVYATGYNVFLWTNSNYTGFDPEVSTRRNTPYTPGVDYSAYPRSRQIVFGLNFNF